MGDTPDPATKSKAWQHHMIFVGYFVSEFAGTESVMRNVLLDVTRLRPDKFMIVVGFPRTSELITKLRKLVEMESLSADTAQNLSEAFAQLDHIVKLRDRIVHYGSMLEDDFSISVRHKPKTPLRWTSLIESDRFTIHELWAAITDLRLIRVRFVYHLSRTTPQHVKARMAPRALKREPWQYIPPEQRPAPK